MRVPHDTHSAALVRHALRQALQQHEVASESVDEVVLVVSELVGNAVRHTEAVGERGIEVEWTIEPGRVSVQVTDPSPIAPALRSPSATDPGGRGLYIVELLAEQWGTRPHGAGKQVWAQVPVRTRAGRPAQPASGTRAPAH